MATAPLEKLLKKAKGTDKYAAGEAMTAILELGKKAAPARDEITALLTDKEPRRSLYAHAILAVLDEDDETHVDALFTAAIGKGDGRSIAKNAIYALPGKRAAAAITRHLSAKNAKLRLMATALAGSTWLIRKELDIDDLVPLVDDENDEIRVAAIHAIQMQVDPEASSPAKPTAKLAPALKKKIAALVSDKNKAVAARAKRFVEMKG